MKIKLIGWDGRVYIDLTIGKMYYAEFVYDERYIRVVDEIGEEQILMEEEFEVIE